MISKSEMLRYIPDNTKSKTGLSSGGTFSKIFYQIIYL